MNTNIKGDFQICISVPLTITGNFERSQYLNLETNLLKNEKLFQKTGALFFS